MEREYRRQLGYSIIAARRTDPGIRFASLLDLGPGLIPIIVSYRIVRRWAEMCRSARYFDVRWHELPLALGAAVLLHLLEAPGMWEAFRARPFDSSLYR
jgi:hypothetical protein